MGITGAHELSHSVKGLSLQEVFAICSYMRKQRDATESQPTIDLDASLLYRSSKLSIDNRMSQLIDISCQFASVGFVVVIVCDGAVRHHTKRASIQRQSSAFVNKVRSYFLRAQMMSIAERKKFAKDENEKSEIKSEETAVYNDIKMLEKRMHHSNVDVGQSFFEAIEKHIKNIPNANLGKKRGVVSVIQAEFQADSLLAYRRVNNISDVVFSSDTDLLAHAGPQCFGIKVFNYTLRGKKAGIDNIEVFAADWDTLTNVINAIRMSPDNENIKKSKNPIFDGIVSPQTRALLAIGLGCDVYKSGVRGVTKTVLKEWLDNHRADYSSPIVLHQKLLQFFGDRFTCDNTRTRKMTYNNNTSSSVDRSHLLKFLDVLLQAFMYEPCNFVKDSQSTVPHTECPMYIHNNRPEKLHIYCKDFSKNSPDILICGDVNDVGICGGLGKRSHEFLLYEGSTKCHRCEVICCQYCTFVISTPNNTDTVEHKYCSKCYLAERVIPECEITEHIPAEQMSASLHKVGIEVGRDDTYDVVYSLYDHFITKNKLIFNEEKLNSCTMPYESESATYFKNESVLFRFNFMDGGMILRNEKLTTTNKLELIQLLAKLVTIKPCPKNRNHSVIPQFLVESANASRIRGGDRLLARALRHSVDADRNEICKAEGAVIIYKNCIGLNIKTLVRASMKNAHYKVCVTFNEHGIVANTCTCKVGCYDSERIMCIHILPVVQQLSMEIYSFYASDFLFNLNQEWDLAFESEINSEALSMLKCNIISLIRASNRFDSNEYSDNDSIGMLLQLYETGTEQSKRGPGPPFNKSLLGPLRNVNFYSPYSESKKTIKKKRKKTNVENTNESVATDILLYKKLQPMEAVPYHTILNMVKFIREHLHEEDDVDETFSTSIGYKLLALRARKSGHLLDVLPSTAKTELRALLDKGDVTYRSPRPRDKQKPAAENENELPAVCNVEPSMDNTEMSTEPPPEHTVTQATNPKYYRKCCVPMCTCDNPSTFYRRLPACPVKKLAGASDGVRRTYAIKQYKRKEWLSRFGLLATGTPSHYLYCSNHIIEKTEVEISWKMNSGAVRTEKMFVQLPRANDATEILTRADHLKRILVDPILPVAKRRSVAQAPKQPSENKKIAVRHCYYINCCVNSSTPGVHFSRVPPVPKNIPTAESRNSVRYTYAKYCVYRAEFLRRIGAASNESRSSMRICNNHQSERVTKPVIYTKKNGETSSSSITFDVPTAFTAKSNMNSCSETKIRSNKGISYSRFENNYLQHSKECAEEREDLGWGYLLHLAMEHNDSLARGDNIPTGQRRPPKYKMFSKQTKKEPVRHKTIIQTTTTSSKIIKVTTGFRSVASMISFICIVCNGDITLMGDTTTNLTWLEEWYFYFERVYGRSVFRLIDCSIKYKINVNILRTIFSKKLNTVLDSRSRWPMFASLLEDQELRDERWNATYENLRIVMWDNTDIKLKTPAHPNLQRNTYSDYYGGNVGKGSVFLQLCGWLGTHELWEGAVSDTDYFSRSGILPLQEQYIDLYDADTSDTNWIIILDRGYKVVGQCFAAGKQKVLQPTFSRPGQAKFTAQDTQLTAAVAADRGANERAVRMSKLSKYLKEGYKQTVSVNDLCDVWLAWSYQCNFSYKPVL